MPDICTERQKRGEKSGRADYLDDWTDRGDGEEREAPRGVEAHDDTATEAEDVAKAGGERGLDRAKLVRVPYLLPLLSLSLSLFSPHF